MAAVRHALLCCACATLAAAVFGCGSEEASGGAGGVGGGIGGEGGTGVGGSSGTDAGDGGTSGGVGCADIVVSPQLLPDESEWSGVKALPGGVWRTSSGLHVAFQAFRWLGDAGTPTGDLTRTWLAVASFDASSGSQSGINVYDIYPPNITSSDSGLYSVAARDDGTLAVGYDWAESGQRPQRVLFLQVGASQPSKSITVPVNGDPLQIALQTAAAWDGEAYALHAYGAPPQFSLHVARVDAQGNVLLPFTQYGVTYNVGYGEAGHKTSTNGVSGRTYVFDADGARLLNGHDRNGTAIPWTPVPADPSGVPGVGAGWPGLVADDVGGAWLAWLQATTSVGGDVLAISHVGPTGSIASYVTSQPPQDDPGNLVSHALVSRGSSVWVASATAQRIYGFDATETSVSVVSVIIDSTSMPKFDIRNMAAFDFQDETWLGFSEQHQGYAGVLRVVKVAPGCVYGPALGKKL